MILQKGKEEKDHEPNWVSHKCIFTHTSCLRKKDIWMLKILTHPGRDFSNFVMIPPNHEWHHDFDIMPNCNIGEGDLNDSITLVEALSET